MFPVPANPKIAKLIIPFFIVLGLLSFVIVQWLVQQGIADETDTILFPGLGTLGLFFVYCFVMCLLALRQPKSSFLSSKDMTALPTPSPIEGTELEAVMEQLGFSFIGKIGRNETVLTWIYLDKPNETMLVVNHLGIAQFCSILTDGFLDATNPSVYKHPFLPATPAIEQYSDAYSAHRNGMKLNIEKHGNVVNIEGIETWLNYEREYGFLEFRKAFIKQASWWGSLALIVISVFVLYVGQKLNVSAEFTPFLRMLPLASSIPLVISWYINRGTIKSPYQSTKRA